MTGNGNYRDGLSNEEIFQRIADIWNAIDCEASCATDGVAWEDERREVTDARYSGDVELALSLTFNALHRIPKSD